MIRNMLSLVVVAVLSGVAGCKSIEVSSSPGATLERAETFYVVQREEGGLHQVISDQLNVMGKHSTTGPQDQMPSTTDVMVTFNPKWQWDITMYLLELKVEFRNPRDQTLLIAGRTYRPSLQRKDSSIMAGEVLDAMFAKAEGATASEVDESSVRH